MKKNSFSLLTVFLLAITISSSAQPTLEKDYSYVMEIPSMITMGSSPAHLYALSDSEGMAVFRTHKDSLQWLYSSTGMEQRGHKITADVRFAYLFGGSRRLTVLEPTSVLGVYSSTTLPSNPLDAKRIGQNLYVALGDKGLGRLSLRTPSSLDSTVTFVRRTKLSNAYINDLEVSGKQLFALSREETLYQFKDSKDEDIALEQTFELSQSLNRIFWVNETLYGADASGNIYEIDGSGNLAKLGSIGETVQKIETWNDWLIIRGSSNRLWTSYQNRSPNLWKKDKEAGNYFTVTGSSLWLSQYNQISRVKSPSPSAAKTDSVSQTQFSGSLNLKAIPNQTIPHSRPLLVPIKFDGNIPAGAVQIAYNSPDITGAKVRGRSFYWEPGSNDSGTHRIKLIATTSGGQTDSTSFKVEVKSFNAPPRFAPIRPISIPVGEEFTLPIQATDPDGTNKELIRFLGVNLPSGASINESTGMFEWTPNARQLGKNQFRVIATDQYGAAKSADITIKVVENVKRGNAGN